MPSMECAAHADRDGCQADEPNACSWSASGGACIGLAPGQAFVVRDDLGRMTVNAEIVNGQLTWTVPALPLMQPSATHPRGFAVLRGVTFHGRITDRGIVGGELGGRAPVPELVTWEGPGEPISMFADLDPSPSDPTTCTAMSVGLRFAAVRAEWGCVP